MRAPKANKPTFCDSEEAALNYSVSTKVMMQISLKCALKAFMERHLLTALYVAKVQSFMNF